MSNLFVVTGRITTEPKKKTTEQGHMKVTFSVSDDETGEDCFYGVSYFLGDREFYLEKGDMVLVDGRLRVKNDNEGKTSLVIAASRVRGLESKLSKYMRKDEIMKTIAEGEMNGTPVEI